MSDIIYKVKRNTKLKDVIKLLFMILQIPAALIAWAASKFCIDSSEDIWLVGEMGDDAKDNGLAFFSYLNKYHPEIHSIYYISGETKAAEKVRSIGDTVETGSFKHKMIFFAAKYVLSTQDGYAIPFKLANWQQFKVVCGWLSPSKKYIFLTHGVQKDDMSSTLNYHRTKFDYVVAATTAEYKEVSSDRYGYPKGSIIQTGLARYDTLYDNISKVNQGQSILFMPTWRYYLADVTDEDFIGSTYYKKIYSLLHSPRLNRLIAEKNINFYFFPPHHEIQSRMPLFKLDATLVKPVGIYNGDFSDILLSSSMMITDFSSVIFDFAYIRRRTAYYQFDLDEYRAGQYKEGYFNYERDGFGPILNSEESLIDEISRAIDEHFEVEAKYMERINKTFKFYDDKCCERLFNILR